jgi:superfamily II DNA or RNA helicase
MKIVIDSPVWACVTDEIDRAREILSYNFKRWDRSRVTGRFTPVIEKRTMVTKQGFFFTGLVPKIQAAEHMTEVVCTYKRKMIGEIRPNLYRITLRDYQKELIAKAIKQKRGIIKAPTGSGKTLIAAGLMSCFPKDYTILFLVHTKSLLTQTRTALSKSLCQPIGLIGAGQEKIKRINIGMIQTLKNWDDHDLKSLSPDVLFVDEAHHAHAPTYMDVLKKFKSQFRYGLTATPKEQRRDDEVGEYLKVTGILGDLIGEVEMETIQDVMAKVTVEMHEYNGPDIFTTVWQHAYDQGIVNCASRNALITEVTERKFTEGKKILIMVKLIQHGENLEAMMPQARFIQGKDDTDTREKIRHHLNNCSSGTIVIATNVFGEGVDIPNLDVLVNAGAGLSRIATTQKAGRVLRKSQTKIEGTIVDFFDFHNKHLLKHAKARKHTYEKLKYEIRLFKV